MLRTHRVDRMPRDVADLHARGFSNQQTAEALDISEDVAAESVRRILEHLDA